MTDWRNANDRENRSTTRLSWTKWPWNGFFSLRILQFPPVNYRFISPMFQIHSPVTSGPRSTETYFRPSPEKKKTFRIVYGKYTREQGRWVLFCPLFFDAELHPQPQQFN